MKLERYKQIFKEALYGAVEPGSEKSEMTPEKVHATKVVVPQASLSILKSKPDFQEMVRTGRIKVKGNEIWVWNNDFGAKAAINITA